ncbi:uncharacterized protein ARB_02117 [Trichophyton benhamiae CBS 112371]|uniref:Uncharacterized protein n=1 Tax=Arthroderma benhamiae (strain ATCC MYA-4681 / CBS 112371) TaxID=663331 RepID=D4B0Y9_ARTBC|nr:uncharacterized protein ARB_02117 [Trichophyton benhamiae CBS 112371]EFE30924.1 hypothetical protein ARB_02117 [Trichophyton benhamiae CBS 112371]
MKKKKEIQRRRRKTKEKRAKIMQKGFKNKKGRKRKWEKVRSDNAKEKEVKKGQGELGDGVWTENMEYKMEKYRYRPAGRPWSAAQRLGENERGHINNKSCHVVDIDLLSSVENKILSTPSAMGGGGSTKREGGKETKFSTGKSGRINSSGSEVDGIEGQAPPSLCPQRAEGGRREDEPLDLLMEQKLLLPSAHGQSS